MNTNLNIKREYINAENNEKNYSDLNVILNKKKLNKKLCIIDYSNINNCKKDKNYLISSSLSTNLWLASKIMWFVIFCFSCSVLQLIK